MYFLNILLHKIFPFQMAFVAMCTWPEACAISVQVAPHYRLSPLACPQVAPVINSVLWPPHKWPQLQTQSFGLPTSGPVTNSVLWLPHKWPSYRLSPLASPLVAPVTHSVFWPPHKWPLLQTQSFGLHTSGPSPLASPQMAPITNCFSSNTV